MKLYYSPGACSLSTHITLAEAGYSYTLERVDLKTKKTETGEDFTAICDKGYVPALKLNSGELLTENAAIIQYLATQKTQASLTPMPGTLGYHFMQEWLNYITSELYKNFGPIFGKMGGEAEETFRKRLQMRFAYVAEKLRGKLYLMGDQFTVADTYLFTVLRWAYALKVLDEATQKAFSDYKARVENRPAVKKALEEEGLLKAKAA